MRSARVCLLFAGISSLIRGSLLVRQTLCLLGGTVAGFLVQWFGTGRNVDIDPDTGRITVHRPLQEGYNQGLLGGGQADAAANYALRPTTGTRVRNLL